MINSVKIIHDGKRIKEYRFWADYFRFIGIHVWDCTLKNDDYSEDFSIVVIIEKDIDKAKLEEVHNQYPNAILLDSVDGRNFNINDNNEGEEKRKEWEVSWTDYLERGLNSIENKLREQGMKQSEFDFESMKIIGKIYVKYCISYFRNVYSYFKEEEFFVQQAQDKFVDAYVALRKDDSSCKETVYTLYTLANLTRYINETCVLLKQKLLLSTEQCLEYLNQAMYLQPTFYNAQLLKGIVCGIDKAFAKESGVYYKRALDNMGKKKYTSYPHYLYGRYWERTMKDITEAKKYYQISYELNELEYRAIYKLAVIAKREGRYEESLRWFQQIRSILSDKEEINYLQPKEYEYLSKAYFEISKLYGDVFWNLDGYEETIKKLNELYGKIINGEPENNAYKELFGEQEQILREATYLRIKTMQMQCKQ